MTVSHGAPIDVKRIVGHWCDMARDDPQFRIRLPAELKSRIEEEAARAGRSLNAEIVHRLGESLIKADIRNQMFNRATETAKAMAPALGPGTAMFELFIALNKAKSAAALIAKESDLDMDIDDSD